MTNYIDKRALEPEFIQKILDLEVAKGEKGDKGERGEQGIQGEQGLQGLKGDTGIAGKVGLKGDKGDTGAQGIQGEQGIQGIKGVDGSNIADSIAWENVISKPEVFPPAPHTHSEYLKDGSRIMNPNTFGGTRIYNSQIDNNFFSYDKRYTVTAKLFSKADNSLVDGSMVGVSSLFDGSFETYLEVPRGHYAEININFNGSRMAGYATGTMILTYYFWFFAQSEKVEVYNDNATGLGVGWHEMNQEDIKRTGTNVIVSARQSEASITDIKYTITAREDEDTYVAQLEFDRDRPGNDEMPYFTKMRPEKLYYDLNMNENKIQNLKSPAVGGDAANKTYVDTAISDISLTKGDKGDRGIQGLKGDKGEAGTTTWAGITDKPASFTPASHSHTISNITGLQAQLDSKQGTLPLENRRKITYGTTEPTGGVSGDIYFQYE